MSVAVIIPALNEAQSLPAVVRDLPDGVRVVVVDNGSTDDTARVAAQLGCEVVHEPRRGYGSAVQAGMAHLGPKPPEVVVILDADHADHPELIGHLATPILDGEADLALSERTLTAERGALTPPQRAGNWLATHLIRRSTGYAYRDMGPFRAVRWTSLIALDMQDPTWGWNVEMQMKAVHHQLRILEIPLPYRARQKGKSKISGSIRGTLRAGARILLAVHTYR
ncbi:MAG: glycosyltransferase family 2 protein [Proteobacteria bacterium]|nr:glycosyltransferase family 2 protein [Pseudomonadota bacterium]